MLIIAETAEQAQEYARRLLEKADDAADVQTVTTEPNAAVAFQVSDKLARKAGFAADAKPADAKPADTGAPATDTGTGTEEGEAPARNASTAEWRTFLAEQDPPVEFPADAKRDELVAIWDARK
jgi:hypothetical protein